VGASREAAVLQKALAYRNAGKLISARDLLRDHVRRSPSPSEALQLLGVICGELNEHGDAVRHLQRATVLTPRSASAHYNLGNALLISGRHEEALASLAKARDMKPTEPPILLAFANALTKLGRSDEAVEIYRQAVARMPDSAEGHENLGRVLFAQERKQEAIPHLQQAVRLAPENAGVLCLLGRALLSVERYEHAVEAFTDTLKLMPDNADATAGLVEANQSLGAWSDYDLHRRRLADLLVREERVSIAPFALLLIADEPELHRISATRAAERSARKIGSREPKPLAVPAAGKKKLRVAYISADFRRHAMSHLTASMFADHDREQIETVGVSLQAGDDSLLRQRVVAGLDTFMDAQDESPEAIAQALRDMSVDIAVDLMGHTKHARLEIFAYRAAPIQVNYLGYPGTTGADYIDYIILDSFIATDRVRANLSEAPVIMPHCYQVNDRLRANPDGPASRAEFGLPETGIVFAAFNNAFKITPDMFDVWMRILGKVEGSVLWLLGSNDKFIANLRNEADARGIGPDRLVFGGFVEPKKHLLRYKVADLFLDTFPYGAHTTASDALWMECPVLTCAGESFASRVAGSLLHTVGLPEFVTENFAEYERRAVELVNQPALLARARVKLHAVRPTTPLFDSKLFASNLERAYQQMWSIYQAGDAPRPIDLAVRL
jgi:protein O-GlcNAc transferase